MTSRSRERQLAKLAARRQADRHAQQRRRSLIAGIVVGTLVVGLAIGGGITILSKDRDKASGTPKPTGSVEPCSTDVPKAAGDTKPTFEEAPKVTIDPKKTYTATMVTSCGTVVMELFPDVAPIGVNNFVFLAKQGFYDGLTFHRVVDGFVIQGGDPKGNGNGDAGYEFVNEISKQVTFDSEGLLAYANSGPDTNGSQFFITLAPTPNLDPSASGSYTIFGKVIEGMEVARLIGSQPAVDLTGQGEASSPITKIYIDSITITEK